MRTPSPSIPASRYVDTADSSAVSMRATAAALRGEFLPSIAGSEAQGWLIRLISTFGLRVVRWAVEQAVSRRATDPALATQVRSDALARWAVSLYEDLPGPFPAILIGAPNGGVAHLATALGVPFLSEHFLISFRNSATGPDDVSGYKASGDALAQPILDHNPDLAVVNHYDPLHDRLLIRHVNHIRVKLLGLPLAYRQFIQRRLEPDGALLFIDSQYPWRQYRVRERHTFQVGGLGGVSDEEFIQGSSAIEAFQRAERSPFIGGWRLDLPLEVQPESEWGTLLQFHQAVEDFAQERGYHFVVLSGDSPEYYSELAFQAYSLLNQKEGRSPQGVLVDCFTQLNPVANRLSRLLPCWLPFNCTDSAAFLERMVSRFPPGRPVLFAPLPGLSPSFDTVPMSRWLEILEGHPVTLVGVNPRHHPFDIAALFRFPGELKTWCQDHPDPVGAWLTVEELLACAGE